MKKAEYLTPVITAFDNNGNLDEKGNKEVYEFLIKNGVDGIVVMGSTGEFFAMSMEQKKKIIDIAVSTIDHRVKCFIGTGCMSAAETIELSNYALKAGADAVMIIGPYYFKLNEHQIEAYYDQVVPNVQGPVYIYNYPGGSGYDMTPEVTVKLLRKYSNIVGYKDTIDKFSHTREILEATIREFPEFNVYSGFDENMVHTMISGGKGCIGGLSNIAPRLCADWVNAINNKNLDEIEQIQLQINSLMEFYTLEEPFIPAMKKAMISLGLDISDKCIEFAPITKEQEKQVEEILTNKGLK